MTSWTWTDVRSSVSGKEAARRDHRDRRQRGVAVDVLAEADDLRDPVQDFERVALRRPQAEPPGNRIDVSIHRLTFRRECFGSSAVRNRTSRRISSSSSFSVGRCSL